MNSIDLVSGKNDKPILIVDRIGVIGSALAHKLKEETTVVLVSRKPTNDEKIIDIGYEKKIPQIPDNNYTHIFLIDDKEKTTRESISSFLDKAQKDEAFLIFVTDFKEAKSDLIEKVAGFYIKAKVILYGDVFGAEELSSVRTPINKFIFQAKNEGKINIPQDSTGVTYPVHFEDLIAGILEVTFGQTSSKIFNLFPKHPPTFISLAHMIQKANPNIKVDFSKENLSEDIIIREDSRYVLDDNYDLEERIRELDLKTTDYSEEEKTNYKGNEVNNFNLRWLILLAVILFLLPFISTQSLLFLGNKSLENITSYVDKREFENARKSASFARNYYSLADKTSTLLNFEIGFVAKDLAQNIQNSIEKGQSKATGASNLLSGISSMDISSIKTGLIYLQKENFEFPLIEFVSDTIDMWPEILGFKNAKTYLVLSQDSEILRPGGGAIDSYALLTLEKGKVKSFTNGKVEEVDNNLKGRVEPPFPIRRYTLSKNWGLENSNFNVDFLRSASSSAFFLSLGKDQNVDGVIGMEAKLFSSLKDQTNKSFLTLLEDLEIALSSKDVIFAFNDPNLQSIFTVNNWSGSISDSREENEKIANDFLGIIDSNLGKDSNKMVEKKITQDTKIDEDGNISTALSMVYENKGSMDYRNYLRLILPIDSEITEIKLNGSTQNIIDAITNPQDYEAEDFKAPAGLEIEEYNQNNKTIFGLFLNIKSNSKQEITISYVLPKKLNTDSNFSYNQTVFKQPGSAFNYNFSLSYPQGHGILKGDPKISKEIKSDLNFIIDLVKK